jgi:hypothetical protein
MSFLAPFFLLGALALALPVVFHLIRRTTRERTLFSSLLLLRPTPPRLTRRSRIEHWLLLLLRSLVVCLLALAFARPFFRSQGGDPDSAAGRRKLILVDASASMRRANLWADARQKVNALLRKTLPGDQVALATFDLSLHPLLSFEQWNAAPPNERAALASTRLAAAAPGWMGTHLGNSLISAAELMSDSSSKAGSAPSEIVVVTDLHEGCRLDGLQGYVWPRNMEVSVEVLKPVHRGNAGLGLVTERDDLSPNTAAAIRVRIMNDATSPREQFRLGWADKEGAGFLGKGQEVYVPAGQSRIFALPVADAGPERVRLEGDEESFDNTVFVTTPETSRLSVLYFGSDSATDPKGPLYFLTRAFQDTRHRAVTVNAPAMTSEIVPSQVESATLLVVTSPLEARQAAALHQALANGKTALVTLSSPGPNSTMAALLGLERLEWTEAQPKSYAMLGQLDFRHPLFAPFADPRYSDFTKIHFWKYRRVDPAALPQAHVLARFDSGDPAILEVPVGKGRVVLLAAGWQPTDSQLALSSKFVPLLYALLETSGATPPPVVQYQVGEQLPQSELQAGNGSSVTLRAPDGSQMNLSQTQPVLLTMPGIYNIISDPTAKMTGRAESPTRPLQFAVNLDPAESRTAPLAAEELARLGVPLGRGASALAMETRRKLVLQDAQFENRQKLWRWVIAAAVVILLFETWLAGRTGRRLSVPAASQELAGP